MDVLFLSGFTKDSGGLLRNYFFSVLSLGTGSPVPSVRSPGSAPDVGSGLAPPVISIWRRLLDIPREDTVKIKAQIPYCYLLSLASSVLCLPAISPLSTPSLYSSPVRVCVRFFKCSMLLHVSGSWSMLFPLLRKLFLPSILPFQA